MVDDIITIKIKKTPLEKWSEYSAWFLVFGHWIYILLRYKHLPEVVPMHFSLDGTINRYDDKSYIWLFPIISLVLTSVIFWLNSKPHWFNYIVKITEENAEKNYRDAINFNRYLVLACNCLFLIISYNVISIATHPHLKFSSFGSYTIRIICGTLIMLPIILLIKQAYKLFK